MQTGLLIIHGTFGSPHEYDELCSILALDGYPTLSVALPGHGDNPDRPLSKVTIDDMLAHCQEAYAALAESCDQIVIMGHSLGGALSLVLAADRCQQGDTQLCGVIALSAPFEHGVWVNRPQALLTIPIRRWLHALVYSREGFIQCKVPLFFPWWFPKLYKQAVDLFGRIRLTLPSITVPVQLAHSPDDIIVPYVEMTKLQQALVNAPNVRCRTWGQCGHQLFPKSREFDLGVTLVLDCLKRWTHVPAVIPSCR